jgi:hypothetical protein
MNVQLKQGFTQVCVWPGTVVGAKQVAEFEQFFLEELGVRVQYLEEILTAPDYKNGYPVEGTGGRCDVLFAVADGDTGKFAIPRLGMGIRWLEDVYGNDGGALYPARVSEYQCWSTAEE